MEGSQFDPNCSGNLTIPQVIVLNNTRSISSMVFFVLTVGILAVLVFYKAYNSTLQRLFIYLTVVTIIQLGAIAMNIELDYDVPNGEVFCNWLAFLDQWTAVMLYLFAFYISVLLLWTICSQLFTRNAAGWQTSSRAKILMEITFTALAFFIPLTFLWVPFKDSAYGHSPAGVGCWLRLLNDSCEKLEFGLRDQIAFGFGIFHLISIAIILIFFTLAVMFCKYAYTYRLTRNHHLTTLCQTLLLMSFMIVSVLIQAAGLVMKILSLTTNNSFPYWFSALFFAAIPFSQFVVPLGFMAYLYSRKKFKWENVKKAAKEWKLAGCEYCYECCCKKTTSISYSRLPGANTVDKATAPVSSRISPPSATFFNVKYTGGFTSITQPVISSRQDTGYGSVVLEKHSTQ